MGGSGAEEHGAEERRRMVASDGWAAWIRRRGPSLAWIWRRLQPRQRRRVGDDNDDAGGGGRPRPTQIRRRSAAVIGAQERSRGARSGRPRGAGQVADFCMRVPWPHGKMVIFADDFTHAAGPTTCKNCVRPFAKTDSVVVFLTSTSDDLCRSTPLIRKFFCMIKREFYCPFIYSEILD